MQTYDAGYGISWEDILTADDIKNIHELAFEYSNTISPGKIGYTNEDVNLIRRSDVIWIPNTTKSQWLYKKISDAVLKLNDEIYKFELIGTETFQYAIYKDTDQGEYSWHNDLIASNNKIRKLSVSILLSDTTEYKGGSFLFAADGKKIEVEQSKGSMIVFASWTPHSVTPILKGTRVSLVLWFWGNRFK
jgi:PKHD-type hydroxylase